ncbi:hypothetical protein WJM97_12885 [Okeanomitos corallinicola TIOX110]|uniref:Uncharacterized protein n=1 Tax=Okeanomitos corallinicola TIOX110 TaxID=3133117 RepID=A0ABZ2ULS2_9CYAN
MQYLAQVHKNDFLKQYQLRLLAIKEDEYLWSTISEETFILLGKEHIMNEKMMVLVELSPTGDIERIEDATSWIVDLVQTYLSTGVTPEFLKQEAENAEQWRQILTLQNQDIARRTLELEARREQIQALEESLNREQNNHSS